ncbi:MBL fold metallo-hydrolase [Cytobacillus oceanisediminis]|uniref:MBL fold metallo-hydrolase n=1 Tax=Cytobacillus oceanisediminis TaxID=665099 RepID=UPI00203FB02E|nr:MBL fold metallo-hydrolase [Cytobacillus oceanisediminis]MCM3405703.1 MBL fold metallo-hydrolase [Cytobacillus oceanisediminis]MDK7666215.1 MBL fold metallo-hydrolase [Cytobacillus oceanisediminis]
MKTYLEPVAKNIYAFLVWDESWNSYNNCYLLLENNNIILIDSGKKEHSHLLFSALKKKGISKSDITHFIATHGHKDHIEAIQFLGEIEGYIHNQDVELIPENIRNKLNMKLPDNGPTVSNLECVLLGHHTKGSVFLYQRESKVLFCGDHICFFGEQLSGNAVDTGVWEREKYKQFVSEWSQNEEMREQHNFSLFIEGLKKITKYDVEYLCTGHGAVLKGKVNEFIPDLLEFE